MTTRFLLTVLAALAVVLGGPFLLILAATVLAAGMLAAGRLAGRIVRAAVRAVMTWQAAAALVLALAITAAAHPAAVLLLAVLTVGGTLAVMSALIAVSVRSTGWRVAG